MYSVHFDVWSGHPGNNLIWSVMADNTTTYLTYPRVTGTATAPELWIPYVMIGVSCVTFLAVHFYCYHKRNRERYLRKRDEKRVKSGLLERRRITTLMVARYQSNLGISRDDPSVHQHLYYSMQEDSQNVSKGNQQGVYLNDKCITELHHSSFPESASMHLSQTAELRTPRITSSKSWPLVSEHSAESSNAHSKIVVGKGKPDPGDHTSNSHFKMSKNTEGELAKELLGHSNAGRTNIYGYGGQSYLPYRHYSPAMLRPPQPQYPNVFYTNLPSNTPSQFTSPSPLFFKLKQNKQRYDGVPVDEVSDMYKLHHEHHLVHDRGEVSSPFYDDGDMSEPYIMADPNDDGFGYGSRGHSHYYPTVLDASGFAVSEIEAYPFTDFRGDYGGLERNSVAPREIINMDKLPPNRRVINGGYANSIRRDQAKISVQNGMHMKRKTVESRNNNNRHPSMTFSLNDTITPNEPPKGNHFNNYVNSPLLYEQSDHSTHPKSMENACQLNPVCRINTTTNCNNQLTVDQIPTVVDQSSRAPGELPVKPYLKLPYADNCATSSESESPTENSTRSQTSKYCNQAPWSPWATPVSPKISRYEASSCSPLLSPTSLGHYSTSSSRGCTSSTSPRHTPETSPLRTPSTPDSVTLQISPHRTPPLRTLNPNLVFQHKSNKTN
ncbi:uncharacterized protein LOC106059835 isoform X2 [Biomphalaria glabrata]|uniref:Uncharacterized protein LOC106059835 isoform X2 n=1 Tax=Biomphalaria glabrata TaxID=6526 RepID=A0A9W3AAI6_BIOGL|nr:uncharacterized protein LOC106059835 isoform X2 [Biomphalaria glabrata]